MMAARKMILMGVVLALISTTVIAARMANRLVIAEAEPHVSDCRGELPKGVVVIVPGSWVRADGTPGRVVRDRLRCARDLYEQGYGWRILVSGDHGTKGYDEVNAMRQWLLAEGVPSEDIFLDHAGLRTFDTMVRAARVFQVEEAIVCTQELYLHRSIFLGRHAGIEMVGIAADGPGYSPSRWQDTRETLARVRAALDVYLPGTSPRHLGPVIPIDGDAKATHDQ